MLAGWVAFHPSDETNTADNLVKCNTDDCTGDKEERGCNKPPRTTLSTLVLAAEIMKLVSAVAVA